jgi:PAS domain S-box-containing protein
MKTKKSGKIGKSPSSKRPQSGKKKPIRKDALRSTIEGQEAGNEQLHSFNSEGAAVALADISELAERTADLPAAGASLRGEQLKRASAEEAVRAGEVRFRTIADPLPELICYIDADGRYQFNNKAYETRYGIPAREFTGRSVRDMMGEEGYEIARPYIERALKGERCSYQGYVPHRLTGQRYYHVDYVPHQDRDARIQGLYVSIQDLTELKQAEEMFRAVVENAPAAMIIHNVDGKITVSNSQAERLFGYSRQELIGQPVEILMPDRYREKHVEQSQVYMRNPIRRPMGVGLELCGQHKDGSEFPVEISLVPVGTASGSLVLATIHDLTERRELAERTRWATVLQERARMARDIHDTLAQGFTGVILNLEAAEEACADLPKEARDRIARARNVARSSLEEARRSVLALSSPLSVNGDLTRSIRELLDRCRLSTKTKMEFSTQGTAVPLALDIEENLLRIAQQAVDNALQHARASSIRLELAFAEKQVQLEIADDGRGFDVEKAAHSLGLTGMRERAKAIGGTFNLNSQPGKGTRVAVKVPLLVARRPKASP